MNAENISYSKIEGSSNLLNVTSKSAILQPNEWLSYYDLDDNFCYNSSRNKLISSNGIYSLNLNPDGGGFFFYFSIMLFNFIFSFLFKRHN